MDFIALGCHALNLGCRDSTLLIFLFFIAVFNNGLGPWALGPLELGLWVVML